MTLINDTANSINTYHLLHLASNFAEQVPVLSHNMFGKQFSAQGHTGTCITRSNQKRWHYLYEGWLVAPGPPSGKRPGGPARRSADWACSGGGALSAASPGTRWAGGLCTAGQQYCAQTLVPGTCRCYPPGSSGRPPPGAQREERRTDKAWGISHLRSIQNTSEQ